jgi:excisionase family DNA binding protein
MKLRSADFGRETITGFLFAVLEKSMDLIDTVENWGRLLLVEELAGLTSISSKTLYRYIKQRKLPAIRIGGCIRLNPATTAEWLRSRQS